MSNFLKLIGLGLTATFFMDLFNKVGTAFNVVTPINYEMIGALIYSWINFDFIHSSPKELIDYSLGSYAGGVIHYFIGIIVAIPLFFFLYKDKIYFKLFFYGLFTSCISLFLVYPSIGAGFMASNLPNSELLIATSVFNHAAFGLGLVSYELFNRKFSERS
jgi:hypothetical protein